MPKVAAMSSAITVIVGISEGLSRYFAVTTPPGTPYAIIESI